MAGRKPKPTHLKLVEGNAGRRPLNRKEPKPKASAPTGKNAAPKHLSEKARQVWTRVQVELSRSGILTDVDHPALEMLCEAFADYFRAGDELRAFGSHYYETVNQAGGVMHRAHPAVAVMRDADRRIKGWLAEFGMTPSARSRVERVGEEEEDPADRFLT